MKHAGLIIQPRRLLRIDLTGDGRRLKRRCGRAERDRREIAIGHQQLVLCGEEAPDSLRRRYLPGVGQPEAPPGLLLELRELLVVPGCRELPAQLGGQTARVPRP